MERTENTLTGITAQQAKEGYDHNIHIIDENQIKMGSNTFTNNEVVRDKVFRFEGMTNPPDSSICYALKSNSVDKGILVNTYGVKTSSTIGAFIHDVKMGKE